MYRMLLALSLALSAAGVLAAEPVPVEAESAGCPKVEPAKPASNGEGPTAAARPGTPTPVRPRSSSARGTPRWQSLLPGMFL